MATDLCLATTKNGMTTKPSGRVHFYKIKALTTSIPRYSLWARLETWINSDR